MKTLLQCLCALGSCVLFVLLIAAMGDPMVQVPPPPEAVGTKVKHLPVLWSEFKVPYGGKTLSLTLPEDSVRKQPEDGSLPIVFLSQYYCVELTAARLDNKERLKLQVAHTNDDGIPVRCGDFRTFEHSENQGSEAYEVDYQSKFTAVFVPVHPGTYLRIQARCVSPLPSARGDFQKMCLWIGNHN